MKSMADLLIEIYPWVKALHIISVISWMAGLFYFPRLLVYHSEKSVTGDSRDDLLKEMESKLLRVIMNPAMIATWIFGILLVSTPGIVDWGSVWPYTKGSGILILTWFHHWLALRRKDFLNGANTLSGRTYRLMNEVPTVCLILIVFSVVLKF